FQALIRSRIWLILLFITPTTVIAEALSTTKIEITKCGDEMLCFASSICGGADGREMVKLFSSEANSNCPAVLKIRPYSNKHWLVVSMQQLSRSLLSTALIRCCSPVQKKSLQLKLSSRKRK
ncbi:hypothetical protein PFISCL1PPCAC_11510, partial [Pristionchus fissidentatus]